MPVGLVEAEHERAGDPVRLLDPQQLVEVAAHAVDVEAEMDVRVEELGVRRQLRAHELVEALDEALRAAKDVFHERESTDGGVGRVSGASVSGPGRAGAAAPPALPGGARLRTGRGDCARRRLVDDVDARAGRSTVERGSAASAWRGEVPGAPRDPR